MNTTPEHGLARVDNNAATATANGISPKSMIRTFIIIACLICASLTGEAQINLVINGDFEQKKTCPYAYDQVKDALYWSCIDTAFISPLDSLIGFHYCSPEYCNLCGTGGGSVPSNIWFYQYPRSGAGMFDMGMYTDGVTFTDYQRDYLMGRLSNTLLIGQSYCVTFYVVLANHSNYAINNIGAYLDDGSIDTNAFCGHVHTQYTPQVVESSIINDTLNWIKIQGNFIANGTEKYITIGNFTDTAHTNKIHLDLGHIAMYEVDDVSVIPSDATAYAGPDKYAGTGDTVAIGAETNGGGMPCYWYTLGGTAPVDSGGTIRVRVAGTTTYVVSMDLCGTVTYDTVTVTDTGCGAGPVAAYTYGGSPVYGGTDTLNFVYAGTGTVDSVRWDFGDGSTATGLSNMHVYTVPPDSFYVCLMVYGPCGADTVCQWVHTVACTVPAATFTSSPAGGYTQTIAYTGSTLYVDSVIWQMGDGSKRYGSLPFVYTYAGSGVYTVCAIAYSRCGNDTGCQVVNLTLGTSLQPWFGSAQHDINEISVWPNPAGNEVHVDGAGDATYRVMSMTGVCIQEGVLTKAVNTFSLKNYPSGVYILELTGGGGMRSVVRLLHTSQ